MLLMVVLAAAAEPEPTSSRLTLASVAEQIVARQARLERIYIDAYMVTTEQGGTQTDRYAVAYIPGFCFLDFMHLTGPNTPPWRDNGRFQVWLTPDRATLFKPFKRALYPDRSSELQDYWKSPYGVVTGWHPHAKTFELGDGQPFFLDHLFVPERRDRLVLRQETEEIDSFECVAIKTDSGSGQLWLAPSLGFALVKRITMSGEARQFKKTFYSRNFKEAEEGLWLPWEVESEDFEVVDGKEELLRSFRLELQELAVNDAVPDAIFRFKPPPGTITYDAKDNTVAFEPRGEDLLDLWGAVCWDVFPPSPPKSTPFWQVALSAATCALGSISLIVAVIGTLCTRAPAQPKVNTTDSS